MRGGGVAQEDAGAAGRRGAAAAAGFVLFAQGLRPFFLIAGLWAPAGVALWLAALAGLPLPEGPLPLGRWHAHEMLAGFVGAALSGFLLTAVPNWTGRAPYAGPGLVALAGLFLAGRLALLPGSPVPIGLAAPLALAALPAALLTVAPAVRQAGQARLAGPPLLVLLAWAGDVLMLGEAAGWWPGATWAAGQLLMADVALLLVGLIGGRIIPAFTRNALRKAARRDAEARPLLPGVDAAAIAALAAVALVDLAAPGGPAAGVVAAAAAVLVALRLSRWQGLRTLDQPILWVLHLAYAFVPLSLAVKAAWLLAGAPWAAGWLHLQGAGALALMILAVMTRATLGHTGRPLVAAPATAAAYALLALAALARGFGPALGGGTAALAVAGALWTAAFALFLAVHAPMLLAPRADGKPG